MYLLVKVCRALQIMIAIDREYDGKMKHRQKLKGGESFEMEIRTLIPAEYGFEKAHRSREEFVDVEETKQHSLLSLVSINHA